ncbi:MAG: hypothetical protein U9O89_04455 [Thermoproteota archaeon]|nr:hypothetical protein [Thermoproteota archaeon]
MLNLMTALKKRKESDKKKMKTKMTAIFATLMVVLTVVGFAYAHWEKTITINGTVETGEIDLTIIEAVDDDDDIDPGKNKDVAQTTITIDPEDPEKAIITIINAYPSYEVTWNITIKNTGTIPVKLQQINVTTPECITAETWGDIGEQIDPESWGGTPDKYQTENSGRIHLEQSTVLGETYTLTIEFIYVNWNEYIPPPPT